MKKNLFKKEVTEEILARLQRLSADSLANWGVMNAAEMLHHCSKALKGILQPDSNAKPSTLKQKIARYAVLYFVAALPKGAKAPKQIDVKLNNITGLDFNMEQQFFSTILKDFVAFDGAIVRAHPYFGKLTRKQWGIFMWMHLDHHLRQFGV